MPNSINKAKTWQIALFASNNLATNVFLGLMLYVSYYAVGVAGLSVIGVSFLLTGMRIFDGITDPIIGYIIDKTDTKFGKFRPMMLLGYVIMAITTIILFNTVHLAPESSRFGYFAFLYSIYIIGYTFQTACTKAGQACLTNDASQRPTFSLYDGIYNAIFFAMLPLYTLNYLVPKYTIGDVNGLNNVALHHELLGTMLCISGFLTMLAIIGIAQKDRKEFFGIGNSQVQVKFSDYIDILKNNKAIQMLVFAASTDKLAMQTMGNASVLIIIFAIATGNPALQGEVSVFLPIISLIVLFFGIKMASRMGTKKSFVTFTALGVVLCTILGAMVLYGPMHTISMTNLNTFSMLFIGTYWLTKGIISVTSSVVIPMIPDCADYETYRSGRYVPGMMGTLFSFVDKLVSSLATTIVGLCLATVGFTDKLPTNQTPLTPELLQMGVFLFVGMTILGAICSLIAMKHYPLTKEKMAEIQDEIDRIKHESMTQAQPLPTDTNKIPAH